MTGRPRNAKGLLTKRNGVPQPSLHKARAGASRNNPSKYTKRHPSTTPTLLAAAECENESVFFLFTSLHSFRPVLAAKANIFHLRLRSYCCGSTALSRRAAGKRCSFAADFPPLNNTAHTTLFRTPTPSTPPILWRGQPHPYSASFRGGRKSKKPESSTASLVQPEASTRNTLMNPPVGGIFVF